MSQVVQQEALTRLPVGKGVFTKEEFLEMVKVTNRERKRRGAKNGVIFSGGAFSCNRVFTNSHKRFALQVDLNDKCEAKNPHVRG